ncbi:MAG: DUF4412 domain-containing protein [Elusimicrobia bacterium]|nr:DUF4412 domain-containing protein [Elusimicrobiota bacterium]
MKFIKLFFQTILPVFFCFSIAWPGVVINMEMESVKGVNYQKTKAWYSIVPLASRLDMNISIPQKPDPSEESEEAEPRTQRATVILRLDKKVFWMIMPENKAYCEFTFEDFKKMQEEGKTPLTEGNPQSISGSFGYKRVKGAKKIIGYTAKKYNIWDDKYTGVSWAADIKKFGTIEKFGKNQAEAFKEYGILGVGEKHNVPGIVLEQKTKTEDGVSSEVKVKSIRIKKFSGDTFSLPEDFTEIDLQAWMKFKDSFNPGKIWSKMKEEVKEQAKEEIKSQGRKAATSAVKGLLGW